MGRDSIHWLDVEEIGERLFEAHPKTDPLAVKFTELRRMVEALPGFAAEPGHQVNEKILETIQMRWHEAFTDVRREEE